MYYKKDGQAPRPMTSDRTASPNTSWKAEQLAAHGFEIVPDPVVVPAEKTDEQKVDELIAQKIKDLAITALKAEGKLDADGKIKKEK